MIHPTHTFRPALNSGVFAAADPLRPEQLRAANLTSTAC
jgi:hypothetical protein